MVLLYLADYSSAVLVAESVNKHTTIIQLIYRSTSVSQHPFEVPAART